MTQTQVSYWQNVEQRRHNTRVERETERSNLVNEQEKLRSNLAQEGIAWAKHQEDVRSHKASESITSARDAETKRSNLAKEAETNRSNLAKEAETYRSNLAKETETNRSNVNRESLELMNVTSDRMKIREQERSNRENEAINWHKAWWGAEKDKAQAAQATSQTVRNYIGGVGDIVDTGISATSFIRPMLGGY